METNEDRERKGAEQTEKKGKDFLKMSELF